MKRELNMSQWGQDTYTCICMKECDFLQGPDVWFQDSRESQYMFGIHAGTMVYMSWEAGI